MKILMISKFFPPVTGGISTYFYKLAYHFHEKGLIIKVLTPLTGVNDLNFDARQSFPLIRLREGKSRFIKRIPGMFQILFTIIRFKPRIIFLSSWFPYGVFILICRKIFNIKVACSAHGSEILGLQPEYKQFGFLNSIGIYCLKNFDRIFAVSRYTRDLVLRLGVNPGWVVNIPNGVDVEDFYEIRLSRNDLMKKYLLKNIEDSFIILTISYLAKRKGHETVISAIELLRESKIKVHYLIGGDGPHLENLKSIVQKRKLENDITFLGRIPPGDLSSFYRFADVFAMMSYEEKNNADIEGFGIVFLEANACSTPVIGSKSGGIPDAISDGVNGYLLPPLSPEILAEKLRYLHNNKNQLNRMGADGYALVKKNYSWTSVTDNMLRNFKEIQ